jgi:hypothetical protein
MNWLREIDKTEKPRKLVVYSEKLWFHREDLAKWERQTGRTLRTMQVPFNLK